MQLWKTSRFCPNENRTMRYSMESALKLFLFVSLVTFSTVTLGHVHSMGLELKVMWFHRSGPLTKTEDGRVPQIQFAQTLGPDSFKMILMFMRRSKTHCKLHENQPILKQIQGLVLPWENCWVWCTAGHDTLYLGVTDWVGDTLGFWNLSNVSSIWTKSQVGAAYFLDGIICLGATVLANGHCEGPQKKNLLRFATWRCNGLRLGMLGTDSTLQCHDAKSTLVADTRTKISLV